MSLRNLAFLIASVAATSFGLCEGSASSSTGPCTADGDCGAGVCDLGRCVDRPASVYAPTRLAVSPTDDFAHTGRSAFVLASDALTRAFRVELGERVVAAPRLLPDGRALVVTVRGKAAVLEASGAVSARADLGIEVLSSPGVDAQGRILVASSAGELHVLDGALRTLARGSLGERVEGPITRLPLGLFAVPTRGIALVTSEAIELRRIPTPTVLRAGIAYHPDGMLVVATPEGRLIAHRADGSRVFDVDAGASVESACAVDPTGDILVGNDLGQLRRFDRTGSMRTTFEAPLDLRATPTPLPSGDVLLLSLDGHARILGPSNELRADLDTHAPLRSPALVDARGRIVFGGHDGRLHLLDAEGHELRTATVGADIDVSPLLLPDGTLLVVADDGAVHGFR